MERVPWGSPFGSNMILDTLPDAEISSTYLSNMRVDGWPLHAMSAVYRFWFPPT